ncbi:MAG: Plasma membrane t-SNARE, secretory vesicle fusion [Vezdaea aestivalis]|nr:MAG: Plasma membrane t-SNARE, secretory vesicle fusion [Vezdaea aestivalis]
MSVSPAIPSSFESRHFLFTFTSSYSPESGYGNNQGNSSQGGNPYQDNPYGQSGGGQGGQGGYGGRPGGAGGSGYGGNQGRYGGNDYEMEPVNGGQQAPTGPDPNAIRNECRAIDQGIDQISANLEQLRQLQNRSLNDTSTSPSSSTNRELDTLSGDTMTMYRNFADRLRKIKSQPESGSPTNAPQVGKTDRALKKAINQYQGVERDFRKKLQAQMERQYRIVRPDASDAEVREAVEDTSNQQVFSQALLQSDRRGQSQSALRAVSDRHVAIQKIEQQMIELAQLFQDMETLVVQQEAHVQNIEQKGEEVTENVSKGNEEISGAIEKARSRNRKKWWCLLIVLLIIIVVVVVAVVVTVVNKKTKPA